MIQMLPWQVLRKDKIYLKPLDASDDPSNFVIISKEPYNNIYWYAIRFNLIDMIDFNSTNLSYYYFKMIEQTYFLDIEDAKKTANEALTATKQFLLCSDNVVNFI